MPLLQHPAQPLRSHLQGRACLIYMQSSTLGLNSSVQGIGMQMLEPLETCTVCDFVTARDTTALIRRMEAQIGAPVAASAIDILFTPAGDSRAGFSGSSPTSKAEWACAGWPGEGLKQGHNCLFPAAEDCRGGAKLCVTLCQLTQMIYMHTT